MTPTVTVELLLSTVAAGMTFRTSAPDLTLTQKNELLDRLKRSSAPVRIEAAEICLNLRPLADKPQFSLDSLSKALFNELVRGDVNQVSYLNSTLGSYDRFGNRVTPADMGGLFPDGTMRFVWRDAEQVVGLDQTIERLQLAVALLSACQKAAFYQLTEDEFEANDDVSVRERRIKLLAKCNLWGLAVASIRPLKASAFSAVLDHLAGMPVAEDSALTIS